MKEFEKNSAEWDIIATKLHEEFNIELRKFIDEKCKVGSITGKAILATKFGVQFLDKFNHYDLTDKTKYQCGSCFSVLDKEK